jgi:general secretion pathway protein F
MPRFTYKAVSSEGEVIEGELEAASRQAAVERLHSQGHVPIRAEEARRVVATQTSGGLGLGLRSKRVTGQDVTNLTRELATLLQAGLPLDRGMTIMIDLTRPGAVRTLIEGLRDAVRGGATLADAVQAQSGLFPNYYVGMVRAGEAGGTLEAVLARLAETLERAQALRENVSSALRYPALVVIMAIVSVFVLMTLVIPEFRPLFEEGGAELPVLTRVVIGLSDLVAAFWWLFVLVALALVLGVRQHNRSPAGRLRWDRWVIGTPLFGDLIVKIEVARFSRTLGTLLANGVSVLNALAMTVETLDNRAVAEVIARAHGRLAKGEGLADPLRESGIFPGLALQLIRVGEESGQLDQMLLRIAEIYDVEVQRAIQRMLSLLVPIVTLGLGALIAVIIGAMMSAILSAYELPF